MSTFTPQQLKRVLAEAGFHVFRTQGEDIVLAERVRENLIMDSGVRLRAGSPLQVRVVLRAQRGHFPNDDETRIFERVSQLAESARAAGFVEKERTVAPVADPGDAARTLDTFYEIVLGKDADALDLALDDVRFALSLEKLAGEKT